MVYKYIEYRFYTIIIDKIESLFWRQKRRTIAFHINSYTNYVVLNLFGNNINF